MSSFVPLEGAASGVGCECALHAGRPKRVVLTGGPGAGKTAVLEMVRRAFCRHVVVLPESASILFGGGFPRRGSDAARRAAQRAIFRVERELEEIADAEPDIAVALCDRGTVDGLAYWPGAADEFWASLGTTIHEELARYDTVIHLRTPGAIGYPGDNGVRTESAEEAIRIDARIAEAWDGHPKRHFVKGTDDFLDKVSTALSYIRAEVPPCCRRHVIPELEERATKRE